MKLTVRVEFYVEADLDRLTDVRDQLSLTEDDGVPSGVLPVVSSMKPEALIATQIISMAALRTAYDGFAVERGQEIPPGAFKDWWMDDGNLPRQNPAE